MPDSVTRSEGPSRRVVLVANPVSGRGRAADVARSAAAALEAEGHRAECIATRLEPSESWLDPAIGGADAMIVVGGDGAVRMAADGAIRTGVPLHHLPLGTENLFAREFGSSTRIESLLAAVAGGRREMVDVGIVGGETFLLMASIGFDADVVHSLAEHRTGAISHLSYIRPILRCAGRWRAPRIDVLLDGTPLVTGVRGTVVIANCRQYGGRLDPAGDASMTDGLLDVVVLPARTALGMARRVIQCRTRTIGRAAAVPRGRGREIRVRCTPASCVQVDGDPLGDLHERRETLRCTVRRGVLPVLIGPSVR